MIEINVTNDETQTLKQHLRRVTLKDGPVIAAKKSRQAVAFQVEHLSMKWFEGSKVRAVVAHGYYVHPQHGVIIVERSFDLNGKTPKWIRQIVG